MHPFVPDIIFWSGSFSTPETLQIHLRYLLEGQENMRPESENPSFPYEKLAALQSNLILISLTQSRKLENSVEPLAP
jgi:hypothetical protein